MLFVVSPPGGHASPGLTARERDIARQLMAGGTSKEIGRELGISPRTVEAYRANLMMKMGAESLSDLVRMAIEARADD